MTALPSALDPADARFVGMQRTAMALKAYSDHPDTNGELGDKAYTKSSDLQHDAIDMTVATPAGALASLLWGREEFARYYIDEAETPDWLDRFTLRMIDNAISVLRAEVSNG